MTNKNTPDYSSYTLDELRTAIDLLDTKLVALLQQRMQISKAVGACKRSNAKMPCLQPYRERQLMQRLYQINDDVMPKHHVRAIYQEILSASRSLQHREIIGIIESDSITVCREVQGQLGKQASFQFFHSAEELLSHICASKTIGAIAFSSDEDKLRTWHHLFQAYPVTIMAELQPEMAGATCRICLIAAYIIPPEDPCTTKYIIKIPANPSVSPAHICTDWQALYRIAPQLTPPGANSFACVEIPLSYESPAALHLRDLFQSNGYTPVCTGSFATFI